MKLLQNLSTASLMVLAVSLASADSAAPPAKPQSDSESHSAFRPVLDEKPKSRPGAEKDKLLKVRIFPFYDKLPRGEKCPIAVELDVKDGWHIHANPAQPKYSIATKVKLKTSQKVTVSKVVYPKHHLHRMKDETEDSHVYDGKVIVLLLLEIDSAEKSAAAELEFEVGYQACNDKVCRPPDKVVMRGKLPLADPGDDIKKINEDKFRKDKEKTQDGEPQR